MAEKKDEKKTTYSKYGWQAKHRQSNTYWSLIIPNWISLFTFCCNHSWFTAFVRCTHKQDVFSSNIVHDTSFYFLLIFPYLLHLLNSWLGWWCWTLSTHLVIFVVWKLIETYWTTQRVFRMSNVWPHWHEFNHIWSKECSYIQELFDLNNSTISSVLSLAIKQK